MADKPKEQVEMAPDPDEDDLDDLDDVLDEFSAPKPASKTTQAAPTASGPGRPADASSSASHDLPSDAELNAQLQSGMKDLMGDLDGNEDMQREFEKMMQELIAAGQAGSDKEALDHIGKATEAVTHPSAPETGGASGAKDSGGKKDAESFQDTIRKTMERMQASGDSASAAAASGAGGGSEEDMLARMMQELQAGGGTEGGGEEDFNKMLMGMMAQLTNKEILYEPMKELHDKFPAWMEKNEGKAAKDELERYKEQQVLVGEIVGRFERKGYSDEDEGDREFIVERMQKMQAAGSPPPDLVGDMSAAQEALGDLEGGCPTQ